MGLRFRRSVKIMPGVRVTFSPRGMSTSIGVNGARVTRGANGRITRTLGIPGTGVYDVETVRPAPRQRSTPRPTLAQQIAAAPPSPGLFASGAERAFVKAWRAGDTAALQGVAVDHPEAAAVCGIVLATNLVNTGDWPAALEAIRLTAQNRAAIASDPLFAKYLARQSIEVSIAAGVSAQLRLDATSIGLVYTELLQQTEHLQEALAVARTLEPGPCTALSLADLHDEAAQWDDAIAATEGVTAQDDITALTLVYRGIAFREKGLFEAARECFKQALASRKRDAAVRHKALFERAATYRAEGKNALARKDLERIMAEDSDYPGVVDALAQLGGAVTAAGSAEAPATPVGDQPGGSQV